MHICTFSQNVEFPKEKLMSNFLKNNYVETQQNREYNRVTLALDDLQSCANLHGA